MKKILAGFILAAVTMVSVAMGADIPQLGWPVAKATTVVTPFGWVSPQHGVGTLHFNRVNVGVDLSTSPGDSVEAVENGTVLFVMPSYPSLPGYVVLRHYDVSGNPYTSFYQGVTGVTLKAGDVVVKGQVVGYALGTSIHFGVRNSDAVPTIAAAMTSFFTTYFGPTAYKMNRGTYPDGWVDPLLYLPIR